ncbi:hypothetical protein [Halomonas sp. M4R1S46]|uniref:hypothetical protein n=1 Tax=Halomonas sp. M4R1S46 TaxID=2982692 RepID=UPI0021E488F4|nr:hypothetical protein [Halomonas sp. M4R1S46]UYG09736.1 hypothetical protein OCT48_16305 [Halomonas sp. M4R1S46]
MVIYVAFFLIFVGVTLALYQVYSVHYAINFEDEEERPERVNQALKSLTDEARGCAGGEPSPGFVQAVRRIFGSGVDARLVLAAVASGKQKAFAEPLLRRKRRIETNGELRIAHLPFWKTRPPARYRRGPVLMIVMASSLLALFWGAASIFTAAYPVAAPSLAWANNVFVLAALVYASALLAHGASKLDLYLHDIQQIGRLNRRVNGSEGVEQFA